MLSSLRSGRGRSPKLWGSLLSWHQPSQDRRRQWGAAPALASCQVRSFSDPSHLLDLLRPRPALHVRPDAPVPPSPVWNLRPCGPLGGGQGQGLEWGQSLRSLQRTASSSCPSRPLHTGRGFLGSGGRSVQMLTWKQRPAQRSARADECSYTHPASASHHGSKNQPRQRGWVPGRDQALPAWQCLSASHGQRGDATGWRS